MTDHPIIYSAPMVRALLEGRKTMTRRLAWRIKMNPGGHIPDGGGGQMDYIEPHEEHTRTSWQRVKPGDRLWVRENLKLDLDREREWFYCADDEGVSLPSNDPRVPDMIAWAHHQERSAVPSIHMPRWASRLTLVVTATKIERLRAISEDDAKAEGMLRQKLIIDGEEVDGWFGWSDNAASKSARHAFECVWCNLHGIESWRDNPEVVALTFTVHARNIDQQEAA